MALPKTNIRSVRFSDEMMELIDQQVGANFTQKFERLVYNAYLFNIYKDFGAYIDGIEESLDLIYFRLTRMYDFLTGYLDEAGNEPGTNLYDKLDELVTAIEGVSGGGSVNFDTQPIVDKLQEVVDALDSTPVINKLGEVITAIDGISFDTLPIVTELQNIFRRLMAVDFATNERVDALLAEIEKISTYADLHEVVTVTPGVLGDVDVVTTGEWRYEDLTFYYEPSGASKTFSPDTNHGYQIFEGHTAVTGGALDLSLYGSYSAVSVTLGNQTLYALNNQGSYGTPCDLTVTVYFNDGSSQEVSVFDLYADADHTVLMAAPDGTQITHAMCYFPSGSDNQEWYLDYGTDPFMFTLGNMVASPADSLSFTSDGVPHTLYFSNEFELSDGCYEGDFIFYDDGHWFKENVNSSGGAVPLYYYDTYLTDALTGSPTSTTTMEGETYTWFEWFYTSYGKGGSGGASDLTPVVMRLDTIIENLNATVGVAGCNHIYELEINQEPTCILPGLQTQSCTQCESCYSEILDSLGHDWQYKGYVNEELNVGGEIVKEAHHLFECSRCGEIFYDYDNAGDPETVPAAPAKESDTITGIIARLFEKLGKLFGDLLSGIITLLDKLLTGFDDVVTGFNEKAEQIATVGGDYPQWLSGVWGIIPADLQLVLSFCVIAMCVAVIGKKIFFVS